MPNTRSAPSRRSFLASTAVAAAAVGSAGPLLTACSSDGGSGDGGGPGRVSEKEAEQILPAYQASEFAVQPDIPGQSGSSPGYTSYIEVADLGVSVPEPLAGGTALSAMTPLWGTAPKKGNPYWTAMDEAIGTAMTWQIQDGNTYGDKLGAVLAGSDIPDLVCIPGWEYNKGQIPKAVEQRFADLGPYLSGDKVLKYPNLAAIPTAAWKASIFGGALRGLPMPQQVIGGVVPFYREDIFEQNGWTPPTSADEFLAFAKEITDAGSKRWACEDFKWSAWVYFGVLPEKPMCWREEGGKLVHRYETDAYLEALEWTRKLYEAGVVHPDAVAAAGDATARFTAGESLMMNTGSGVWHGTVSEQLTGGNPDFRMNAMDFFRHDGGDPVLYAGNGAGIWTFLSKDLPEEKILAALELANFCAAPYGTYENRLRDYGVEGTHYTVENGVPVRTPDGEAQAAQVTYGFIASPEVAIAHPDQPKVVEDKCAWEQRMMPFVQEPLFYGRQIQEPDHLANLSDPFEALEDDVVRGRKSLSDMQNAVAEWRRTGGDELRDWYQKLLDEETA
ncbi:extracellular solute-binding protein [Streptomyces aidingensis]|uniref:Putative aldouronate transport system substrate-binding protein n=1 Tax=Streptomyces aidingensis TaxID=910347 RepID=A0A1I1NXT7_9ACTN|nr:extracellular solute-binding protein [Streptomyces aidingensis]SFD02142.1 putative aldouronate transport system substrate-binding protein [Streptomyces aidingensis]